MFFTKDFFIIIQLLLDLTLFFRSELISGGILNLKIFSISIGVYLNRYSFLSRPRSIHVYTLEEMKQITWHFLRAIYTTQCVNSFIHAISFTPHKQPLHKSSGYLLL